MDNKKYYITDLHGNFYTCTMDGCKISEGQAAATCYTYINAELIYKHILSEYEKKFFRIVPVDEIVGKQIEENLCRSKKRVNQMISLRNMHNKKYQ